MTAALLKELAWLASVEASVAVDEDETEYLLALSDHAHAMAEAIDDAEVRRCA